jgi:endonuclease
MQIYDRPTKSLMADWAKAHLSPGQTFGKAEPVKWFAQNYPKIKSNTVAMHVEGMSVNNLNRRHHPNIKPRSGYDLFFKLGPNQFRLWDAKTDPAPRYKDDIEKGEASGEVEVQTAATDLVDAAEEAAREFAFEKDLENYLVKNLGFIEPGLRLYEEEGITGVQFPAGGRIIDVLAVDKNGRFVVIELKVSRGYDRTVGQLLRYMGWVEANMETTKPVRGIIVANEITMDLKLACARIPDVQLIEYEISFKLRPVTP